MSPRSSPLPHCALCGRSCIPLDDYDVPICIRCDDRMTTVLEVAGDVATLAGPPAQPLAPIPTATPPGDSPTLFDELREWVAYYERKTA